MDEDDSETEDILRETIVTLLTLNYGQAYGQLESMEQELELLRSMPPPPPPQEDSRTGNGKAKAEDDMWKLDAPRPSGGPDGQGPILDASGKVRAGACALLSLFTGLFASPYGHSQSCLLGQTTVRGYRHKSSSPIIDCQP